MEYISSSNNLSTQSSPHILLGDFNTLCKADYTDEEWNEIRSKREDWGRVGSTLSSNYKINIGNDENDMDDYSYTIASEPPTKVTKNHFTYLQNH